MVIAGRIGGQRKEGICRKKAEKRRGLKRTGRYGGGYANPGPSQGVERWAAIGNLYESL